MRDVEMRFPKVDALRITHLDLHIGEVLDLMGEDSAGHSTLLKILTLIDQPASGAIHFEGKPITLAFAACGPAAGHHRCRQRLERHVQHE